MDRPQTKTIAVQTYAEWAMITRPTQTGLDLFFSHHGLIFHPTRTPRRYLPATRGRYRKGISTQHRVHMKDQRTQIPRDGVPEPSTAIKGKIILPSNAVLAKLERARRTIVDGPQPSTSTDEPDQPATAIEELQPSTSTAAFSVGDLPREEPIPSTSSADYRPINPQSELLFEDSLLASPPSDGPSTLPSERDAATSTEDEFIQGWVLVDPSSVPPDDLLEYELLELPPPGENLDPTGQFKIPPVPEQTRPRTPGASLEPIFAAREALRKEAQGQNEGAPAVQEHQTEALDTTLEDVAITGEEELEAAQGEASLPPSDDPADGLLRITEELLEAMSE